MISIFIGNPAVFAIECSIVQVYERISQRALGFFVIYINGRCYGVRKDDATMLACSFNAVKERIKYRGQHCVSFASEPDINKIVHAYRLAVYFGAKSEDCFFGMNETEFYNVVIASRIGWVPDGDEAFDDGSNVLQFDIGDKVRLIAFINEEGLQNSLSTVSEIWLDSNEYYGILSEWQHRFEMEWAAELKNT
jgi:Immunity protein 42